MSNVFHRTQLASDMADKILYVPPGSASSSGLFLAAPRRTGKSTFLREDLRPQLEAKGALVVYADLWENRKADPGAVIIAAVRAELAKHEGVVTRLARASGMDKVSVGGLSFHKGNHVLIDACKVLARRGIPFECDIVGDGPEHDSLIRMTRDHGLGEVFRFHGFVDDNALAEIASRCAILACPGLEEPWGIRVNDALHAGFIPVVSHGVGASQLVARFGAGLIFPEGDSVALAECLSTLHHNPSVVEDLRARIAIAARHISPTVAATYLRAVVGACTNAAAERPSPQWL